MTRRSAQMEKEHEEKDYLRGHKIVQTCNHVQELGIKPTRHNQDDNSMGRAKNDEKSHEEVIVEYAQGDQTYSICLDCSNKSQDLEELK